MKALTGASYESLGGWSTDLASQGWLVLLSEPERCKPLPQDVLYINIMEFLTVFINTWLVIHILLTKETPSGG